MVGSKIKVGEYKGAPMIGVSKCEKMEVVGAKTQTFIAGCCWAQLCHHMMTLGRRALLRNGHYERCRCALLNVGCTLGTLKQDKAVSKCNTLIHYAHILM